MSPRDESKKAAESFAERLKAARKQARLTQEALGARAEIAPVTLSKLETGINMPTFEILVALAHALDVTPNFLTGWDSARDVQGTSEQRQLIARLGLTTQSLPPDMIEQLLVLSEKIVDLAKRSEN